MKADVEIVTGFLGSGKTSLINILLENTLAKGERTVVVQCEMGVTAIDERWRNNPQVIIREYDSQKPLTSESLLFLIKLHKPHRILIEHNGTALLNNILNMMYSSGLKSYCKVTTIFNITDATTFNIYVRNIGELIVDPIVNSHLIILNNTSKLSEEDADKIYTTMEIMNPRAYILKSEKLAVLKERLLKEDVLDKGVMKDLRITWKNWLAK
jgi:G3E family GTPase